MPIPPKAPAHLYPDAAKEISVPVHTTNQPAELVFDEADTLFSKRSEVRDANDRYSNDSTDSQPHKP